MIRYPELRRRHVLPAARRGRPTRERVRMLMRRAAALGFFFAPAILLVSTPSLVLLDLKLSLPSVGFFTGTVTTVSNIAMTILSGALLTRIAAHRLVALLATGVAASGILLAVATTLHSAELGVAGR